MATFMPRMVSVRCLVGLPSAGLWHLSVWSNRCFQNIYQGRQFIVRNTSNCTIWSPNTANNFASFKVSLSPMYYTTWEYFMFESKQTRYSHAKSLTFLIIIWIMFYRKLKHSCFSYFHLWWYEVMYQMSRMHACARPFFFCRLFVHLVFIEVSEEDLVKFSKKIRTLIIFSLKFYPVLVLCNLLWKFL